MNFGLIASVVAALGVNVLVSLAVLRSQTSLRSQKSFQIALVWLLPVVGAIVVWGVIDSDHREASRLDGDRFDPPVNPPGIGPP